MKEVSGHRANINMLKPSGAKKMLRTHVAVDGNNKKQVEVMEDRAEYWREKMRTISRLVRVRAILEGICYFSANVLQFSGLTEH